MPCRHAFMCRARAPSGASSRCVSCRLPYSESYVPAAACAQLGRAELSHKISVLHGLERKASVLMAGEHKKLPAHMDIDDLKEVRVEGPVRSRAPCAVCTCVRLSALPGRALLAASNT